MQAKTRRRIALGLTAAVLVAVGVTAHAQAARCTKPCISALQVTPQAQAFADVTVHNAKRRGRIRVVWRQDRRVRGKWRRIGGRAGWERHRSNGFRTAFRGRKVRGRVRYTLTVVAFRPKRKSQRRLFVTNGG